MGSRGRAEQCCLAAGRGRAALSVRAGQAASCTGAQEGMATCRQAHRRRSPSGPAAGAGRLRSAAGPRPRAAQVGAVGMSTWLAAGQEVQRAPFAGGASTHTSTPLPQNSRRHLLQAQGAGSAGAQAAAQQLHQGLGLEALRQDGACGWSRGPAGRWTGQELNRRFRGRPTACMQAPPPRRLTASEPEVRKPRGVGEAVERGGAVQARQQPVPAAAHARVDAAGAARGGLRVGAALLRQRRACGGCNNQPAFVAAW